MTESQSERLLRALEDLVDEVRATKHEICVLRVDLINRWQPAAVEAPREARPDGPPTRGSR